MKINDSAAMCSQTKSPVSTGNEDGCILMLPGLEKVNTHHVEST